MDNLKLDFGSKITFSIMLVAHIYFIGNLSKKFVTEILS